jgi:5-methylthioadenosine/S-adenosylhomocysteine deaminase
MSSIHIKNATLVTMSKDGIIQGDVFIKEDHISKIGQFPYELADIEIDAAGKYVIPGMIQTHIHLCQTLFRGTADDLELLDWLRKRTWPLEAAHTYDTAYASAFLGCMELICSGTTCIADMGSIKNADADAKAMFDIGIRGKFGKAMTDFGDLPPELGSLPSAFAESMNESIDQSLALIRDWHQKANGRIQYLFAPRGVLSSSEELLLELKRLASEYKTGIHTHACENRTETKRVIEQRGANEIKYMHKLGLTGPNLLLAHCVWADEQDLEILGQTGTKVLHCPSANLKLASGIAPVPAMLDRGIVVSLGADGAPCNNNLDAFVEMRLASLLQKGILLDPTIMPAKKVFEMATIDGAKTLGLEDSIGSIEVGKKADLVIINLSYPHSIPHSNIYSTIVYSAGRENVDTVVIDGKLILKNKHFVEFDSDKALFECQRASEKLLQQAEISI